MNDLNHPNSPAPTTRRDFLKKTSTAVAAGTVLGGLTLEQAAECLNISLSTADRAWRYARAWLYTSMAGEPPEKK